MFVAILFSIMLSKAVRFCEGSNIRIRTSCSYLKHRVCIKDRNIRKCHSLDRPCHQIFNSRRFFSDSSDSPFMVITTEADASAADRILYRVSLRRARRNCHLRICNAFKQTNSRLQAILRTHTMYIALYLTP